MFGWVAKAEVLGAEELEERPKRVQACCGRLSLDKRLPFGFLYTNLLVSFWFVFLLVSRKRRWSRRATPSARRMPFRRRCSDLPSLPRRRPRRTTRWKG